MQLRAVAEELGIQLVVIGVLLRKRSEAHLCRAELTAKLGLLQSWAYLKLAYLKLAYLKYPTRITESKGGDATLVKTLRASQRRDQCLLG